MALTTAARCPFLVLAAAAFLCASCGERRPVAEPAIALEADRFPHARHADLVCTECHDLAAVLRGKPARPGGEDHAPCDRDACHRPAFAAPPGPLCAICHDEIDPAAPEQTTLAPYPPARPTRALASHFSHRRHLDFAAIEAEVGFHVSCTDCHRLGADLSLRAPDHAVCGRCHAPGAAPPGTPSLDECTACHRGKPEAVRRGSRFRAGDLRFDHREHRADRRGVLIRCAECHPDSRSAGSAELGAHAKVDVGRCVDCHDDPSRVPSERRMQSCETCHTQIRANFAAIAPRSHLPASEVPPDHTLAFRHDHAADAEDGAARCARCHTFLSGNDRNTCDECHSLMRPRDHLATWREFDHGPDAATERDRCATCHSADFCTACHSQTPRSHVPLAAFRGAGHGIPAAQNPRACITCHVPERDCSGSGCHRSP